MLRERCRLLGDGREVVVSEAVDKIPPWLSINFFFFFLLTRHLTTNTIIYFRKWRPS